MNIVLQLTSRVPQFIEQSQLETNEGNCATKLDTLT